MKNDNEITDWMTVKGNHIPIRKGQTREAAMLAFLSETEDNEPFKDRTKDIKKGKALSQKEFAVWYKKIGEVKRGGYVDRAPNGTMYIPIENKIAITAGTYEKPKLKGVISFPDEEKMFEGLEKLKGK